MISFHELLKSYDIDHCDVRLVRHGNKQLDVLDTFVLDQDKFTEYTAWQKEGRYGNAKHLAIFSPARGTTALFLGLWSVDGVTPNSTLLKKHLKSLIKHDLPERWYQTSDRYHLCLTDVMSDLSERLVIEWGKSTLNWVQKKDKEIVQIKPKNSIGEFDCYDSVQLTFSDLIKLHKDSDSNATWVNALSSVNGIYLIKDSLQGGLYVGSAYGKNGIFGRWAHYAKSGHGGNKLLKALDPKHFEFSILEIAPSTMSAGEVTDRETRWKIRLGTRNFGLNDN